MLSSTIKNPANVLLLVSVLLCTASCGQNAQRSANDKGIVISGTPRRYYDYSTQKDTCQTDSCLARIISDYDSLHRLHAERFIRNLLHDDTSINGDYCGREYAPAADAMLMQQTGESFSCYYIVRGTAWVNPGKRTVGYFTKDSSVIRYKLACGLKENDSAAFYCDVEVTDQTRAAAHTITYLCDSVYLLDKPFGRKMALLHDKKKILNADYFAEAYHEHNFYVFAHVKGKEGYWVQVYECVNEALLANTINQPPSFHYLVSLVEDVPDQKGMSICPGVGR